ncbi:MAG: hypothetical protein ABIR15_14740 [Chitinophagaceae bacterium]
MKNLLPIFIFSVISIKALSQHSQLTVSEDFKIVEKEYQDETIAHSVYHNNCFFSATNSGIGSNYKWAFTKLYDLKYAVTISKFDKNMNKVKDFVLENGEKAFGPLLPQLLLVNNKLCLVFFQSDNKSSFNLYLAPIEETNVTMGEKIKICTIQQENVGIFKLESIVNAGIVYFSNSADNSKTLIACNASPGNILTFVIDNNLNILKQTAIHTNNAGFEISSAVLTNDNLECMVLASDKDTKIVCNTADGKKSEMKLNPSGNLVPYNTRANLSNDGKSICIYSTSAMMDREDKSCNGFLVSQLDCSNLKLSKSQAYEFSPEFLETVYNKGAGFKHKKEFFIHNFIPRLIELDNGSLAIIGSPQFISSSTSQSGPNMNNQTHMVSTTTAETGSVFAFFPNKNGKTFEYAFVPRNLTFSIGQSSGSGAIKIVSSPSFSTSYAGFTAAKSGDGIVILYNDGKKNMEKAENDKIAETTSPKDIVLAEALINKDKKLEYRKLIDNSTSSRYTYYLGNTIPTSISSIIFPIGKQGVGFNARKTYYTNWCFVDLK